LPSKGKFDEVVFFNTYISTTTISNLYNGGAGIRVCNTVDCDSATSSATSTNPICEFTDSVDEDFLIDYMFFWWKILVALGLLIAGWKLMVHFRYKLFPKV